MCINGRIAGNQFFPCKTVRIQEVLLLQSRVCVLASTGSCRSRESVLELREVNGSGLWLDLLNKFRKETSRHF